MWKNCLDVKKEVFLIATILYYLIFYIRSLIFVIHFPACILYLIIKSMIALFIIIFS